MTLPRRNRPDSEVRRQASERSHAALSARGGVPSARPVVPVKDSGIASTRQHSFSVSGAVASAAGTHKLYNDTGRDQQIELVRASLGGGSDLTINVECDGVALFSSDITVPGGGTVLAVPDAANDWPVGSYLTVPTGSGGTDLVVTVISH